MRVIVFDVMLLIQALVFDVLLLMRFLVFDAEVIMHARSIFVITDDHKKSIQALGMKKRARSLFG